MGFTCCGKKDFAETNPKLSYIRIKSSYHCFFSGIFE